MRMKIPGPLTLCTFALAMADLCAAAESSSYSAGPLEFLGSLTANVGANLQYTADVNADGYTDILLLVWTSPNEARHGPNPGLVLINNGDNSFRIADGVSFHLPGRHGQTFFRSGGE